MAESTTANDICLACEGAFDCSHREQPREYPSCMGIRPELDPHGLAPTAPGAKLDAGKNRLGLVLCGFSHALEQVGLIGTFGAAKYSPGGWAHVPDGEARYTDAMLRHLMAEAGGQTYDSDSGLHHAAHLAWNALARLELMLRKDAA